VYLENLNEIKQKWYMY